MDNNTAYLDYLKHRSHLGYIYRKYWLYPKLAKHLSGNVLDIGCGIGDFLKFRPNTIGVDINPEIVSWCVDDGLDVRLMQPDLLDFPDAIFDCVVLDNVLEHLESPEKLLKEIKRVTVSGGTFLVGVPGLKGYKTDSDHKIYYDLKSLMSTLEASGFVKHEIFYMPIRLPFLSKLISQYCLYGVFRK